MRVVTLGPKKAWQTSLCYYFKGDIILVPNPSYPIHPYGLIAGL